MKTRSWVAEYWATGPANVLLGGVSKGRSSRWGSLELAERFLAISLDNNRSAGRPCEGRVAPSSNLPEIFVHCGEFHQAIGCICPGCGKKLTKADAIEAGERASFEV